MARTDARSSGHDDAIKIFYCSWLILALKFDAKIGLILQETLEKDSK